MSGEDQHNRSAFEVARMLDIRGGTTWSGLLTPSADAVGTFIDDLKGELAAQQGGSVRVIDVGALTVPDLVTSVRDEGVACVLLVNFEVWTKERWKALDADRDALQREAPLLFLLTPESAASLSRLAPNLRSFLGALHVIGFDASEMGNIDRHQRLSELRDFYQMTDDEVVARAKSNNLPFEPHFVEWLVLIDRGDLI